MPLPLERNVRSSDGTRIAASAIQPLPTRLDFIAVAERRLRPVGQHVDDHVGRRAAGGLGEHVGHALQVLVVDHLVDAGRLPAAQFGQRNQLAGCCL